MKHALADLRISVAAIVLMIAGFFFIHNYNPRFGIIANASYGQIWFTAEMRLPYRYLLAAVIVVVALNVMAMMTQKGVRRG